MSGGVKRATRVSERIRVEIAPILRDLSDPRVQGVLVSRVDVSDDLSSARIFVRREVGAEAKERVRLVKGLEAASVRVRTALAHAIGLRYAPALRFFYDEGPDARDRVEELLREVRDDDADKKR